MTEIRYANQFSWQRIRLWEELGNGSAKPFTDKLGIKLYDPPSDGVNVRGGEYTAMNGFFVGMIIHIDVNTASEDSICEFVKIPFSAYNTETTLGTVTIPAGETGCFFSDNLSENSRTFSRKDVLRLNVRVSDTGGSTGEEVGGWQFLIGWENELGINKHSEDI